jgi:hypothetical protein
MGVASYQDDNCSQCIDKVSDNIKAKTFASFFNSSTSSQPTIESNVSTERSNISPPLKSEGKQLDTPNQSSSKITSLFPLSRPSARKIVIGNEDNIDEKIDENLCETSHDHDLSSLSSIKRDRCPNIMAQLSRKRTFLDVDKEVEDEVEKKNLKLNTNQREDIQKDFNGIQMSYGEEKSIKSETDGDVYKSDINVTDNNRNLESHNYNDSDNKNNNSEDNIDNENDDKGNYANENVDSECICPICDKNIILLSINDRNVHVNNCCTSDESGAKTPVRAKISKGIRKPSMHDYFGRKV